MDRVEFHRLAVLFSGGLIEREMRSAFSGRTTPKKACVDCDNRAFWRKNMFPALFWWVNRWEGMSLRPSRDAILLANGGEASRAKRRTPTHSRRRSRLETSIYFARFA